LEIYLPKGSTVFRDSSMPESSVVSAKDISPRNIRVVGQDVSEESWKNTEHKDTDFNKMWFGGK